MKHEFHLSFKEEFSDYLFITLGLLMYAIGFTCFQLPYQITTGGVAGAGAVLFYAFGLPVHYTFFGVNIILLSIAIKVLGLKFCMKTIYAVIMLTVLLALGQKAMFELGQLNPGQYTFSAQQLPQLLGTQSFMACVIGAALEGIALGIVFLNNGSTGGTDIIAAIVNKYRDVTMGQMMMFCDIIIITSSLLTPTGSLQNVLYGYCTLIISNLLIDYVMDRGRQSVQFLIFSQRYDLIAAEISKTGRGVTVLNGMGWYTKHDRKVLVVLAKKRESTNLFRIIKRIDSDAFVSQSKVIGVFGEGFDKIKVKAKKE